MRFQILLSSSVDLWYIRIDKVSVTEPSFNLLLIADIYVVKPQSGKFTCLKNIISRYLSLRYDRMFYLHMYYLYLYTLNMIACYKGNQNKMFCLGVTPNLLK